MNEIRELIISTLEEFDNPTWEVIQTRVKKYYLGDTDSIGFHNDMENELRSLISEGKVKYSVVYRLG